MLASLLRGVGMSHAMLVPARQQFVNLRTFRDHLMSSSLPPTRNVRAFSRRRNIFLNPTADRNRNGDGTFEELSDLYDSSRFNDDGDDIATTSSTVPEDHAAEDASRSKDLKVFTARNVKVKTAEFLKSSVTVKDCPPPVYPEFAVIGRSNVGKSSLINLITGRNSLAMVSKTPGKTKCINHFLINGSWYLVDLPGYGYARVSKENVAGWSKFTREYFLERENLAAVLVLVDASIPPMQLDIECASWLAEAEVPFVLVYTKLDKRKKGVPPARENIAAFEAALLERYEVLPPAVATSSRTGKGKGELLALIGQMRSAYNSQKV